MRKAMIFLLISGLAGLALVAWGLYMLWHKPVPPASGVYEDYNQGTITIGTQTLHTAVADTFASRAQGLSDRPSMPLDDGMLFIFPIAAQYSFWMKDMHFPLDMIWIKDGTIVDISHDVPVPPPGAALTSLPTFKPQAPVDQVLEVNAGLAAKYGWKRGDGVYFVHA